jgi:hypothetical protein
VLDPENFPQKWLPNFGKHDASKHQFSRTLQLRIRARLEKRRPDAVNLTPPAAASRACRRKAPEFE